MFKRKKLLFIFAAVILLFATACTGAFLQPNMQDTAKPGTSSPERPQLYWNVDRELYAQKSEIGLSSRKLGDDGYYTVRFFCNGDLIDMKVTSRATINKIDENILMGLEIDNDGTVSRVIPLSETPYRDDFCRLFYVAKYDDGVVTLNSSQTLTGMEETLPLTKDMRIWDMSGVSGEPGTPAEPFYMDQVLILTDEDRVPLEIYLYKRPEYMHSHAGYCQHCKKDVTWQEWNRKDSLPLNSGHFQLQEDLAVTGQQNMNLSAEICLDLNGFRVDGAENRRIYALFNPNTRLAIMDTAKVPTGTIAAHGTGDQGMCIWARYGEIFLYGGILDGSDASSKISGTTVSLSSETHLTMYGGEIIGGTNLNGSNASGRGGALSIGEKANFTMENGIIRDGKALTSNNNPSQSGKDEESTLGFGGNIYSAEESLVIMNGGTISGGSAGNSGGNIYLDGSARFIMNGGTIQDGIVENYGRFGGNIGVSPQATMIIHGGTVTGGTTSASAGNIFCTGTLIINGGAVEESICLIYDSGSADETALARNILVEGGSFIMRGGFADGGVECRNTAVTLTGTASVQGKNGSSGLFLGIGATLSVEELSQGAGIGLTVSENFTSEETAQSNLAYFYSDDSSRAVVFENGCIQIK